MGSLGEFNFLSKTSDWLRLNSDLLMANFLMIMCCKCHRCVLWTSGSADCKNIDTVHKNMLAVSSESKSIRGPEVRFIEGDGLGYHAQPKLQIFLMIWATLNGWSPWNWSSKTSELQIFLMIWRISLVPQMPHRSVLAVKHTMTVPICVENHWLCSCTWTKVDLHVPQVRRPRSHIRRQYPSHAWLRMAILLILLPYDSCVILDCQFADGAVQYALHAISTHGWACSRSISVSFACFWNCPLSTPSWIKVPW